MNTLKFNLLKTGTLTKDEGILILNLADRAKKLGAIGDTLTISMDIEAGTQAYNIDLFKLEKFDDYNFMHDIFGLQDRINRSKQYFEDDLWLPRSVKHEEEKKNEK
jgi:hypothetical protein